MPIYTYRCPHCENETEVLRRIDDRYKVVECGNCRQFMNLVVEAPAFTIKEALVDRLNRNYKKRQEKKAKGELLE